MAAGATRTVVAVATIVTAPDGSVAPGATLDLPEDEAARLVSLGLALDAPVTAVEAEPAARPARAKRG